MGESVVKSAAMLLGKVAVEEVKYLGAVTGKVKILESELDALASFLVVAVKTRRQDARVQTALSQARNLAYDCEDVIETYILKVARHGYEEYDDGCQLGSALRWFCLFREAISVHKIQSQVDDLEKRISNLKNSLSGYGAPGVGAQINEESTDPRRPVYKPEHPVVGLEKDLKELIGRLMDPTDKTVITICGMGGLGKSTLANELYNHRDLRHGGFFQAFGWAAASQRLKQKDVLQNILYGLVPPRDRIRRRKIDYDLEAGRGHAALYQVMIQAKCLVVIDDIWTQRDWRSLQEAFPIKSATGSRIVLTTRNRDILSSSSLDQTQVYLHPLEGLDDANSWDLFQKTVFTVGTTTDSTKEKLGREMLVHCKGVPLAIVVLGEALRRKNRAEDWKHMRNDIYAQIGRGSSSNNPMEEVYDVLRVSYDELPYHLKHCFLHLANFPEDYELPTAKVCQLWVAEGIIISENDDEMEEDIAERYLNELVSMNMVQAASWVEGTNNRVKTCRLHDLMRDVCIAVASKEGFLQTVTCKGSMLLTDGDHLLMISLPKKDKTLRRLAVHISDHNSSTVSAAGAATTTTLTSANVSRAPNLRSLLLFSANEQDDCNEKLMKTIIEDYPLLRVFDCEEFNSLQGELPEKVKKLIHLRYLCLAKTHIQRLPSSIENLQGIQTLDLRVDTDIVLDLPNILWKMKQLRHLYLPYYGGLGISEHNRIGNARQRYKMRDGGELRLDGLSKLQTLVHVDLDTFDINGLSQLVRLRTLSAACESNSTKLSRFSKCDGIKSITLRLHGQIMNEDPMILSNFDVIRELEIYGPYPKYTYLNHPISLEMWPKSLVTLGVFYLLFADDPLPILELLPNLLTLDLHLCYFGTNMVCSATGFPRLTRLAFDGLFNFSHWKVEQGALQKLENLMLVNCPISRQKLPHTLPSSVNVTIIGDDYQRKDDDPKDGESGDSEAGGTSGGVGGVVGVGEVIMDAGAAGHNAPTDLAKMEKVELHRDNDKGIFPPTPSAEKGGTSNDGGTGILDELKRINDKFDIVLDYLQNMVETEEPRPFS